MIAASLTEIFNSLFKSLETGASAWNPLYWILAAVIVLILVVILRGFGKRDYKSKTDQTAAFLSGNPEYDQEQMHVKGSNVYWGFTETLKGFYKFLMKTHTGVTSDYILLFVIVLAVLFLIIGVI
jgi:hypothetical protein